MTGPDHHAEMEAHYAAGVERQEEQFLFDVALAEAKARVAEEVEREGFPPAAEILVAWGVGAGVRTAYKMLMPEIGAAREELSRLKCEASQRAALEEIRPHYSGGGLKCIRGSHADIDLVQHWQHEAVRAEYLAGRLDLYLNEAQRLAALVIKLGGDPTPPPAPSLSAGENGK